MKAQDRRVQLTPRGRGLFLAGATAVMLGGSSGVGWLWQWGGLVLMALVLIGLNCRRMGTDLSWNWQWPRHWHEGERRTLRLQVVTKEKPSRSLSHTWLELELVAQDQLAWQLDRVTEPWKSPLGIVLRARECGRVSELVLRWRAVESAGCFQCFQQWQWREPGVILPRALIVPTAALLHREAVADDGVAAAWRQRDGWQRVDWRSSGRTWARQRQLQLRPAPFQQRWTLVLHSFSALPVMVTISEWQDVLRMAMALVRRAVRAGCHVTVRSPAWRGAEWRGASESDLSDLAMRLLELPVSPAASWEQLRHELQAVPVSEELWVLSDQALSGWERRCRNLPHLRLQTVRPRQLRQWQQREEVRS